MHIPDGFVSAEINFACAAATAAFLSVSFRRVMRSGDDDASVPFMAVIAAFIFAAQMLNFPIGGGTSGHFLGAAAAAALLGPWMAGIAISVVLFIQCLFFADGGITAIGSNMLNMGIVGGAFSYLVLRVARYFLPSGLAGYYVSVAVASWISVTSAAGFCALEIVLSGTASAMAIVPAMVAVHAVIGIGEAIIAVALVSYVAAARPDMLPEWAIKDKEKFGRRDFGIVRAVLVAAVLLSLLVAPFSSSLPDGLEKVANETGLIEGDGVWNLAPFADYKVEVVKEEKLATGLSGIFGTMLVFCLGYAALRMLRRTPKTEIAAQE